MDTMDFIALPTSPITILLIIGERLQPTS